MPTISVSQNLLRSLMERQGFEHDVEHVNNELPLLGTDIDACDESTLDIEIFPDRPDLLSGEMHRRVKAVEGKIGSSEEKLS